MSTNQRPDLKCTSDLPFIDGGLLGQLFDQAPDIAFFIKDTSGRYLVVNRSLAERFGAQDKSQIIGRRVGELIPGELGRCHATQDADVLRTGRPLLDHLELHLHRPHHACWCLTTKLPIRDARGSITGLVGISRDVREPGPLDDIPAGLAIAVQALQVDCAGRHSPSSLARLARLSPSRFARVVRRVFGITPSQLITKTRLAAASRMLRETRMSIAEIALECGFCDHSAFTRAFRSASGLTPTQARGAG